MLNELEKIKKEFLDSVEAIKDSKALEELRIKFLGRKSALTSVLRSLGKLVQEERILVGQKANTLRKEIEERLEQIKNSLYKKGASKISTDYTLPGFPLSLGREHPITKTIQEIIDIFSPLGFQVATGPEIETDYYNFEALNFPPDHPARDEQDSFQIDGGKYLLRTQTSPVQIRVMEKTKPPIRIIAPGACYRRDNPDASHSPMFHQVEGLAVDTDIHFTDLKGVLSEFIHQMFGKEIRMRFVPSFFPFTEPSAEVAISCIICGGKGCPTCGKSGWLEVLGAGMVHPNVFKYVNYDPKKYTGFAFGMGVERIAMLKYGIHDIRLFYQNNLQFLNQF
ncbi:MAG: phenylalanine--tRNA ligase subunit alpha [Candidatus Ratteibacteria bacterium]|nr:phenylalanine--tRNA ligase subunit alpha [Candidatus Ratteibacteria bacterium]